VERRRSKVTAVAFVTFIGVISLCAGLVRCGITAHFVGTMHVVKPTQNRALLFWNGLEVITAALACILPFVRSVARGLAERRNRGDLESTD
jgi:hypothetical protein